MTDKLIHRHDQFFKRLLDKPGTAGALLRERLPADVAALLSDDPPELVAGSFVPKELVEYRTDRLYRTRTTSGREVLIYTLVEHKSAPDQRIAVQLLGYVAQILQSWCANNPKRSLLPPILSLVVYNGSATWSVPPSLAQATDADEILRPWVTDLRYNLVDLGSLQDEQLSRQEDLKIGFLILKRGAAGGDLYETLVELGRAALALSPEDLVALIRYLLSEPNGIRIDILHRALRAIVPGQEDRIMSIAAEQWKAEGRAEGRAEGKVEGKAEGRAEGEAEGRRATLLRLIDRRFGAVSADARSRVESADLPTLDFWLDRILDAKTVNDIFAETKLH